MTAVKVCGLTRPEDVRAACDFGAVYLGFNFSASSPRRITLDLARELARTARGALRVGVFVDETPGEIEAAVDAARLDLVQVHRPLRQRDLRLPRPIIAVVTVHREEPATLQASLLEHCYAVLFDSADTRRHGDRAPFDWDRRRPPRPGVPVFLGGGLTPENVMRAVVAFRPAAVDVASGIESAPGIKDRERMGRFFAAVRGADVC